MSNQYNQSNQYGDFNEDGKVDTIDLNYLLVNWNNKQLSNNKMLMCTSS